MSLTVSEIARHVQGDVEGNAQVRIHGLGKIESARTGDITFFTNPKYEAHLYTTQASCVLLARDYVLKQPIAATLIRVDHPYNALSQLLTLYQERSQIRKKGIHASALIAEDVHIPSSAYIGPYVVIEAGASIGENVCIHAFCYVGAQVVLADNVCLYPRVTIYANCHIGAHTIIHAGAVIGADGFGFSRQDTGHYEKIPQIGIVVLEDHVEIGANTTIDRATFGQTHIQEGVKVDNLVQVGHNAVIGKHSVLAGQSGVAGSAIIGEYVTIAGQVGISGHLKVDDNSVLGPQTGVIHPVPKNAKVMGTPHMPVRDYMKAAILLRKLPDIVKRLEQLEAKREQESV